MHEAYTQYQWFVFLFLDMQLRSNVSLLTWFYSSKGKNQNQTLLSLFKEIYIWTLINKKQIEEMNLSELLDSPIGKSIIGRVSGQLGMGESEAAGAVNMAVPAILAGLNRNAKSPEGAESLNKALETKHDGSLLDNLSGMLQGHTQELEQDGKGILSHIFGNNLSAVEEGISQKSGVSKNKIASLLSMVAPIVMAYIGKQKREANADAGGLGDMLGGLLTGSPQGGAGDGIMSMLGGILDKDGDGNPLNDILGGFFGGK